ncbi:MAG: hypothetical protein PVF58_21445 [Candidatus Methanofastidiosia archaeon]
MKKNKIWHSVAWGWEKISLILYVAYLIGVPTAYFLVILYLSMKL